MPLISGTSFAGYTILSQLSSGAMGEVYLAQHARLPRHDALKILNEQLTTQSDYRSRFIREADLASSLSHPHIVEVYDRGEFEDHLWIAMRYVDGFDTRRLLRESHPFGMPPGDVLTVITAIADALDYAHDKGLLHRDIKPANILLNRPHGGKQRVMLTDFGTARNSDEISGLTQTNTTVGTVAYSAPEQLMGHPMDGRADQYALAATAYHLLTGTTLFPNEDAASVINSHLTRQPPRISTIRPELAAVDEVLNKALSKNPADRFRRCLDFANAVGERISGQPGFHLGNADLTLPASVIAPPPWLPQGPPPGQARPPTGRRRSGKLVAALTVGAVLVIAGVVAAIALPDTERTNTAQNTEAARQDARLAAQHYLEALARGQASAALALSDSPPANSQFLTDAVLQQAIAVAPITDITATNPTAGGSTNPDAQRVIIAARFGATPSQTSVWVRRKPGGWRLDNTTATVPLGPTAAQSALPKAVAIWGVPTNGTNPAVVFPGVLMFSSSNRFVDISSAPVPVLLDSLSTDAPPPPVRLTAALNDAGRQGLEAAMDARIRRCYTTNPRPPGCPATIVDSPVFNSPLSPKPGRFTEMSYTLDPLTMRVHMTGTAFWMFRNPDDYRLLINSFWDVSQNPPVFVHGAPSAS
jgi:serine/threonine protein kinase